MNEMSMGERRDKWGWNSPPKCRNCVPGCGTTGRGCSGVVSRRDWRSLPTPIPLQLEVPGPVPGILLAACDSFPCEKTDEEKVAGAERLMHDTEALIDAGATGQTERVVPEVQRRQWSQPSLALRPRGGLGMPENLEKSRVDPEAGCSGAEDESRPPDLSPHLTGLVTGPGYCLS